MLSIQEYISEQAHFESEEETPVFSKYFYAILIDEETSRIFVSEYSNIFLLLDLVLNHDMLSGLTIYRTQQYAPSIEQLRTIQNTVFNQ
jgi:hypothetical protein